MNIVLLGHDDIASKIALSMIANSLPMHNFRLFLSGPLAASKKPLPNSLQSLSRIDRDLYGSLPWDIGCEPEDLPSPNSVDGVSTLRACDPDLFISIRYRRILKSAAIAIPRYGVLNLHSGLLPDYKGVMATFWAMLNGEEKLGCTLHNIVDGTIDTGPIIGLSESPTRKDWTYLANVLELYPAGCRMIVDTVNRIAVGELPETSIQKDEGDYYSTPRPEDLERFASLGLHLADSGDLNNYLMRHSGDRFEIL